MAKRATTPQTSIKMGVRSMAKKQDESRHMFDPVPAARKKPGAFGAEDRVRGTDETDAVAPARGKAAAVRKLKQTRRG